MVKADYDEVLMRYYTLKSEYEAKRAAQKNRILRNITLSTAAKRQKLMRLQAKCISCGKNGGTIFSNTDGTLSAVCGHTGKPCSLNIKIVRKQAMPSNEVADLFKEGVERSKKGIMESKLNILFDYVSEEKGLSMFSDVKEQLDSDSKTFTKAVDMFYDVVENKTRDSDLKAKKLELYLLVREMKEMLEQYKTGGEDATLAAITNLYSDRLVPTAVEIRNLKYQYSGVERLDDDVHKLLQEEYTPGSVEYVLNAAEAVVMSNK